MNVTKENKMSVFGMERHKMRNEAGAAEYELWLIEHSRRKAEKMNESKQDQSTDANCDQANNDNENRGLNDVDDTNVADSQANSDDNCINCTQDSCGSCDEAKPVPLPHYNPDDVAFKKGDITESWYMVDGINAQFETSSDAIAAAHDYVATHTMSTTVHIVASRKFAVIKPVVTTELEYL